MSFPLLATRLRFHIPINNRLQTSSRIARNKHDLHMFPMIVLMPPKPTITINGLGRKRVSSFFRCAATAKINLTQRKNYQSTAHHWPLVSTAGDISTPVMAFRCSEKVANSTWLTKSSSSFISGGPPLFRQSIVFIWTYAHTLVFFLGRGQRQQSEFLPIQTPCEVKIKSIYSSFVNAQSFSNWFLEHWQID